MTCRSDVTIAAILGFLAGVVAGAFVMAGALYFVSLALLVGLGGLLAGALLGMFHVAEKVEWPPPGDWGNRSW